MTMILAASMLASLGAVHQVAAHPLAAVDSPQVRASSVNTQNRAVVVAAYQNWLAPALLVPVNWTGNSAACNMGTASAASRAATVSAVNFMRAMAGLGTVVLDDRLSKNAQAAALIMSANGSLNHAPPKNSACWSQAGFLGANRGNLAIGSGYPSVGGQEPLAGSTGARAIASYMKDEGADNEVVGHRRWILFQRLARVGVGDTVNANALQVVDKFAARQASSWVPWPTAGYFPRELEPKGRWSLSYPGANFERATVKVSTPSGSVEVHQAAVKPGYGDSTIAWQMTLPAGYSDNSEDYPVTVTVDGVVMPDHTTISRTWTTTLVRAAS